MSKNITLMSIAPRCGICTVSQCNKPICYIGCQSKSSLSTRDDECLESQGFVADCFAQGVSAAKSKQIGEICATYDLAVFLGE